METKKFISTLKGFRTRFTNKPNAELEKKSVESLAEKFGGKLEAIASLKESGENELKDYLKKVLGISSTTSNPAPAETTPKVEETKSGKKSSGKVISKDEDGTEYAEVNGKVYQIDSVKKTMKRVYKDFKDLATADLDLASDRVMPMTTYQRYLKDKFPGEDMPIKKGKLHFRGYRISCNAEDGFLVEDTMKHYAVVETPFEGIPTPKELGDWFGTPGDKKLENAEAYKKAVERGKELARKAKEERERNASAKEVEEEPDFEALRKKVLRMISDARSKTIDVDPEKFTEMIPFKRWKRKVKSLYTQWKERKIRYAKFLNEIETLTKEETFVVEEKRHRSSFTGTLMPVHKTVGMLVGDKIEVDGKWIDAVPFLLEYLLFYEKRAMSQIMKYAAGEISDVELIKNPIEIDWKVEYKKRALKNTAHNARVLCMVYDQVGVVAPQDLLYEADLQVGDRIMVAVDGELKQQVVASVEQGIVLGKEIGLLKLDKWIKLPKKETK